MIGTSAVAYFEREIMDADPTTSPDRVLMRTELCALLEGNAKVEAEFGHFGLRADAAQQGLRGRGRNVDDVTQVSAATKKTRGALSGML